jgi:transposase
LFSYCNNQQQLDGPGKHIEIDETCIAKQEHHRGKPKKGASQWVFGGIERAADGLMFAFRFENRTKKTLYPLIRKHILPDTTIISDDWPAYRKLGKQFGKPMGYKHYIICHKKMFARTIKENGQDLRVHTNKSEGSWAHLKHKIKRLYGTTNDLLASYVAEAVFRQNCRAKKWNILERFFNQMEMIYGI